jgi:predicted nucleic acid-binding protein
VGRGQGVPVMTRLVVLDNEAVQALARPRHPKHRRVLGHMEAVERRKRRAASISLVVPAAVRVEAGWDRTSSQWAFLNRLRIMDVPLDAAHANTAAAIHEQAQVSVADAHIGATVQSAPGADIAVLTSDPRDIRIVAGDRPVTIVAI